MKQHITREQWDKLDDKQKIEFIKPLNGDYVGYFGNTDFREIERYPSIGNIIEFLKSDWWKSLRVEGSPLHSPFVVNDEICNSLWEAVKNKLK